MPNGLSEKEKYILASLSQTEKQQLDWLKKEFPVRSNPLLQRYGSNNIKMNNSIKRVLGIVDSNNCCPFCGQAIKNDKE